MAAHDIFHNAAAGGRQVVRGWLKQSSLLSAGDAGSMYYEARADGRKRKHVTCRRIVQIREDKNGDRQPIVAPQGLDRIS